jgi:3-isopropylmalate/(R)-2-methylmalate dehydratase small subunit
VSEPIEVLRSPILVVDRGQVDTDQIIPARFLTTIGREGLGAVAFADWRGQPGCPFDDPRAASAAILVAGENFGCGSSREHAVWALRDFGLRAVVAPSIADIFRQNALKNGLVPVAVADQVAGFLLARPWLAIELDLRAQVLRVPGLGEVGFTVDPFGRHCLLHGVDELGFLLGQEPAIARFEAGRAEVRR